MIPVMDQDALKRSCAEAALAFVEDDMMVGVGTGRPDQVIDLPDRDIDPDSIELDLERDGRWGRWQPFWPV